jgi:hypothetical protein
MATYIGIDLGKEGAVAVLTKGDEGWSVEVQPMPLREDRDLDSEALLDVLFRVEQKGYPADLRIRWEATFRPNSLVRMQGAVDAIASLVSKDAEAVAVVTWKKSILGENTDDKERSLAWVRSRFPAANLRRTKRSRTDSHDFAEAICIGAYGATLDGHSFPVQQVG